MPLDLDDPRLTAYALGELDETEAADLERALAEDPQARATVEEIRATAKLLEAQLHNEAHVGLSETQRSAIERRLARPWVNVRRLGWAAGILIAVGGTTFLGMKLQQRTLTQAQPPRPELLARNDMPRSEPEQTQLFAPAPDPTEGRSRLARHESKDLALGLPEIRLHEELAEVPEASRSEGFVDKDAPASGADRRSFAIEDHVRLRKAGDSFAFGGQPGESHGAAPPRPASPASTELFAKRGGVAAGAEAAPSPQPAGLDASNAPRDALGDLPALKEPEPAQLSQQALAVKPAAPGLEGPVAATMAGGVAGATSLGGAMMGRSPMAGEPLQAYSRNQFAPVIENDFVSTLQEPLSTFSIDVDTASYSVVRRFLLQGSQLPPPDAVRLEELVNYFRYDYPQPQGEEPFATSVEVVRCPWNAEHRLARIGLQGRSIAPEQRPPSNFVFLVDVSGSMNNPDKLPLLKDGLGMLVDQLTENDRVAIVVYANAEGVVLDSITGDRKDQIRAAIDQLQAGGSTNGGAGITRAYQIARKNFVKGGANRVILCTDGDFNVGVTDDASLYRLITEEAKSKVFLSVLGFGSDNLQDAKMEMLADKGNGNYHYIDSAREARKVLVDEMTSNLVTIAKDVKIQVEFNPAKVAAYRLLGYENRKLAAQDFADDTKDAGEIGAGHTVTALYELVPTTAKVEVAAAKQSRFTRPAELKDPSARESFVVAWRYKQPEGDTSVERELPVVDEGKDYSDATADTKFAASVAGFGMLLRNSKYKGNLGYDAVVELAEASKGADPLGLRAEFLEMVRKAKALTPVPPPAAP